MIINIFATLERVNDDKPYIYTKIDEAPMGLGRSRGGVGQLVGVGWPARDDDDKNSSATDFL